MKNVPTFAPKKQRERKKNEKINTTAVNKTATRKIKSEKVKGAQERMKNKTEKIRKTNNSEKQ